MQIHSADIDSPTPTVWPWALLPIVLWWLAAPYEGIRHDAILYAGDALRRLNPEALARDIFFHQDSQGDFSVFGAGYALLIRALGLDTAAHLVTLSGRALWLAAVVWLARTLVSDQRWLWLLVAVVCLPSGYGPLGVLHRAEAFATPRVYAEAASLLALASALRARWGLAGAAWVVGMTMHPLMGVFAGAVLAGLLPRRGAIWVGAALVVLLVAAWPVHLGVLARLGQTFDDAWFEVVEGRNPLILAHSWTAGQWSQAILALLLLLDAQRRLPAGDGLRRMARAMVVVTVSCVTVWLWANESRNVLLLQVQPWRVLWLTLLVAPMCWLAAVFRSDDLRLLPASMLFLAWTMTNGLAAVVGLLALSLQARPQVWQAPQRRRLVLLLMLGLAAIALADAADRLLWVDVAALADHAHWSHALAAWLKEPLIAAALLALAGRCTTVQPMRVPLRAAAACAAVLAGVAWSAQAPPTTQQRAERQLAEQARAHIPVGACVWSELGLASTWLHLQRCSYVTGTQGSGAQFDRALALAMRQRLETLRSLGITGEDWRFQRLGAAHARTADVDADAVRRACEDQALDWLVFRGSAPAAHVVIEASDVPGRLSLFDCHRLRSDA
ncbi:MAG: hypothetical protein Fur0019_18940 [Tibeticola sp.]